MLVGYPSVEEEREIVYRMGNSVPTVSPVLDPHTMVRLQKVAGNVFVHHALVDYVVRVINATRRPAEVGLTDVAGWLSYGASPRATLGIVAAARALALVRGRDYVIPQDVVEMIPDVRHRLVLSHDALADEVDADQVITRVLQTVGLPRVGTQAAGPAGYPQNPAPAQAQQRVRFTSIGRHAPMAANSELPSFDAGLLSDPQLTAALTTLNSPFAASSTACCGVLTSG